MSNENPEATEAMDSRVAKELPQIDGAAAAAILMMTLDDSDAASILKHFDPEELKTLGKAMFAAAEANDAQIDSALNMFVAMGDSMPALAVGAEPRIRKILHEAVGNVRADNLLASIAPKASETLLDLVRWMRIEDIRCLLTDEHPQAAAIILAVLTPDAAAQALADMDGELQSELIYRAAKLQTVSAYALADLEACVRQYSDRAIESGGLQLGGKSDIAKIVNIMKKPDSERLLKSMKKRDKILAQSIEDEMFVFEDLMQLDQKSVGTVMRSIDSNVISLALKGAPEALVDKLVGSMSVRAAEAIRDEMMESGMVKRSEVEEAQKQIIAIARKLADDGEIMLGSGGDDYV